MADLLDLVLILIERREAEQIQYGLYDITVTGEDVLNSFEAGREQGVREALSQLWRRGLIIRFEAEPDHRLWLLRSRTSETVRLVSKLRQRIVRSLREKQMHRADRSPRLVHDLKFEVRPRQIPNRWRAMSALTAPLARGGSGQAEAAAVLNALFPYPKYKFSDFQLRAFEKMSEHIMLRPQRRESRGLVITASTGAGKTYAFFLPVLAHCIVEKGLRGHVGVKAICIYPRVALSENQIEDFVRLIYKANQHLPADRAITVAIDSSASPYQLTDFTRPDDDKLQNTRGWRWEPKPGRYICPFAHCPVCAGEMAVQTVEPSRIFCTSCGAAHPFILFAKEQFLKAPPDVLVATTESLNSRLMSSEYQMLFGYGGFSAPAVVMLDEIHLQSSTKGTQIGFLLRRLAARITRGAQATGQISNLMIVGLSATIAQPKAFFSDLTGLSASAIDLAEPDEEQDMVMAGAERYLFVRASQEEDTAVISTLLQTSMAVVHGMPRPSPEEQENGIAKYKTFGFAQSLDIVGRWLYQLRDAEKMNEEDIDARADMPPERWAIERTPLYWYRAPGHNRRLFPELFGRGTGGPPCGCHTADHPDLGCIYFREGECWWTMRQGLQDPMLIKRKTASDRLEQIRPEDDLIVTTAALEVGYDDATVMGVIQYQAPANVASFVQRKGRGGRQAGTWPMVTTVFSPYKTTDVFLYQNHHLLVEPRFKKLPLNPMNSFLQRIHGFYALFDWLAYLAAGQDMRLAFGDRMDERDYEALRRLTSQAGVLDAFKDYLAQTFGISEPARLRALLVGDPSANALRDDSIFGRGLRDLLMEEMRRAFDGGGGGRLEVQSQVMRSYLPQNLFTDINLPELDVVYGGQAKARSEDIALSLAETMPGNVTFRGGEGSSWIRPPLGPGQIFILESAYALSPDRQHEIDIDLSDLPQRAGQLISAQGRMPQSLTMYRPTRVHMEKFGSRDGSQWMLDRSAEPGELQRIPPGAAAPGRQNIHQVRHSSSAYPVSFTQISAPSTVGRAYSFDVRNGGALFGDLGRMLFNRITFASDSDSRRLMRVRRVVVGSQYSLRLDGEDEPVEGVVTFARQSAPDALAAIGYEMQTEGITFTLADLRADSIAVSDETGARLRRNFIKHAVVTALAARPDINYFAAERFAEVMLTIADLLTHHGSRTPQQFAASCSAGAQDVATALRGMADLVYHLSPKNMQAVEDLFGRPEARAVFADTYQEIHAGGALYARYLEDTFVHTLKHALKQAAQSIAGVEAMEYISAYTQLNLDFGELIDRPIWLYEMGIGGVGVLRSVQEAMRDDPALFWRTLEGEIERCETEEGDLFTLGILGLPTAALEALDALVGQIRAATSFERRRAAIRELLAEAQRLADIHLRRGQIRLLIKLFSDDYVVGGTALRNWRLTHEINLPWVRALAQRLGRLPTAAEAVGLLHYELAHKSDGRRAEARTAYPALAGLLDIYMQEYGSPAEARRAFENAVQRRLLLNCRDACPTCIDEGPSCQIDAPGLSALTLSRALLREAFWVARHARTVQCRASDQTSELAARVEALLQQDLHSPVVVSAPLSQPDILAGLVSYLTDHGIEDRLQRRRPRVVKVREQGGELQLWLALAEEL